MKINKDIKTYIETTLNEEKLWKKQKQKQNA